MGAPLYDRGRKGTPSAMEGWDAKQHIPFTFGSSAICRQTWNFAPSRRREFAFVE